MIEGTVNAALEPVIRLQLLGPSGSAREVDAIVATGYERFLTLPPVIVAELGLESSGHVQVALPDGREVTFESYPSRCLGRSAAGHRRRDLTNRASGGPVDARWPPRAHRGRARRRAGRHRSHYVARASASRRHRGIRPQAHRESLVRPQLAARRHSRQWALCSLRASPGCREFYDRRRAAGDLQPGAPRPRQPSRRLPARLPQDSHPLRRSHRLGTRLQPRGPRCLTP